MRIKPNTDQFKLKKDPSDFLAGSIFEESEKLKENDKISDISLTSVITKQSRREQKEQKVFRLPLDIINALKKESYEKSVSSGTRVTETEIVEQALRKFLNII